MTARNLKQYTFYAYKKVTDDEGCISGGYSNTAQTVDAYIYPASGRVQSEMYGERLAYMLNMIVNSPAAIKEKDGICVFGSEVDYRVISVAQYTEHMQIMLEKVVK